MNTKNITDVLNTVCDKLIERHPHIYGDVEVADRIDEQIRLISSLLVGFDLDLEEGSVISWLKENFPNLYGVIVGKAIYDGTIDIRKLGKI